MHKILKFDTKNKQDDQKAINQIEAERMEIEHQKQLKMIHIVNQRISLRENKEKLWAQ
jgi:hypothetical protein